MPSDSREHFFSVAEANALIPRFELILDRMQRASLKIREELAAIAQEHGERSLDQMSVHQLIQMKPALHPLFEQLSQNVEEIEAQGCLFKGLELGLVDFPARIDGEVVELCWQYGEKEIRFYHGREDGFAGRRPLNPQQKQPLYQ
ncbi:MAG: DUF2203 family protein [Deltaproteobacteria bacterium]|nr:DUF2203 family protein [Deltaproteobacteria bacterium]